jgi:hypothetical protein
MSPIPCLTMRANVGKATWHWALIQIVGTAETTYGIIEVHNHSNKQKGWAGPVKIFFDNSDHDSVMEDLSRLLKDLLYYGVMVKADGASLTKDDAGFDTYEKWEWVPANDPPLVAKRPMAE